MATSNTKRLLAGLTVTATLAATPGCAYLVGSVYSPDGAESKRSIISYLPMRGGMRVVISPRKGGPGWLVPAAGFLGDLVVGINSPLLLMTFPSEAQGYSAATALSVALLGADVGLYFLAGPGRSDPARDKLTPEALQGARVQVSIKASPGESVLVEGLQPRGDVISGYAPLAARFVGKPLSVRITDAAGQTLYSEDTELPPDPWLAYLPSGGATFTESGAARQPMGPPVPAEKVTPPSLSAKLSLADPLEEKAVHAKLGGNLVVRTENKGPGDAKSVRARITLESAPPGLSLADEVLVGDLPASTIKTVSVPFSAAADLVDATASLRVRLEDANGFDSAATRMVFQTLATRIPIFTVEETALTDYENGLPERGEELLLKVRVRNTGKTEARGAEAVLLATDRAIRTPSSRFALGNLAPGAWKVATFSVFVPHKYSGPEALPLQVAFDELRQEAHKVADVKPRLRADKAAIREVYIQAEDDSLAAMALPAPSLNIDVDMPLPRGRSVDKDAVGVIIGIEKYNSKVPSVPFAARDATILKDYFLNVLGVPPENLIVQTNEQATKGAIETVFEGQLPGLITPGKSRVYVYFAGHGVPDPESKTPYLVPYDGNPQYARTSCYAMDKFYSKLGSLEVKSATVMLDACFSGQAGRASSAVGLLAQARPLFISAASSALPPRVTVLAAASADQVSSGYPEKQHGLFTYFLMKGLRGHAAKEGKTTVQDLQTYLEEEVPRIARRMGRTQTPVLLGGRKDEVLIDK